MIITENQHFFSKIIRFQATFKSTVEFTFALEFNISSQQKVIAFLKIIGYTIRGSILWRSTQVAEGSGFEHQ